MNTEIDLLVGEYLSAHPEYAYPSSGDRHPAILALGDQMQSWLMNHFGGPLPYWRTMLESAKVWFPRGCQSREFRIFCALFEADGNTNWSGHLDLEALAREYHVWQLY